MTGLLTAVMHERADAVAAPDVDLDAIIGAGDRRVRRQRTRSVLGAAGLAAAVAVGSMGVAGLLAGPDDLAADPFAFQRRQPAYAVGPTIHLGARAYDVGRPVSSLVQTDDAFVYTTADGRVWMYDGSSSQPVGRAEGHRLRADDQGSLVAWVEPTADGHPDYVVYDTEERTVLARVDDHPADGSVHVDHDAEVFAVDDGTVYWRHGTDLARYDVPSGRVSLLATSIPPSDPASDEAGAVRDIVDVSYGTIAYTVEDGPRRGIAVGPVPDPTGTVVAQATTGALSPDAQLLATEENDSLAIYTTDDGQDVTPTVEGYRYQVAYGWSDDDVAVVLGIRGWSGDRANGDVLRCDVSDDACTVVSSFRGVAPEAFVPAVGDPTT